MATSVSADSEEPGCCCFLRKRPQSTRVAPKRLSPSESGGKRVSSMKATKKGSYSIKQDDDQDYEHGILAIAVLKDGRRLIANERRLKLFSQEMKFLSAVSANSDVSGLVVLNENEAIVGGYFKLVFVGISDKELQVKREMNINYHTYGLCKFNDRLIVTCPDETPPCVKMIDLTSKGFWTKGLENQGHPLFEGSTHISSNGDVVMVTSSDYGKLTALKGETGEIIEIIDLPSRREAEWIHPYGITVDGTGNVYVCFRSTNEVAIFSRDLKEMRILLSKQTGLGTRPTAIAHDSKNNQLLVSHAFEDTFDCFQLA